MSRELDILSKHNLRNTKNRSEILKIFLQNEHALSHKAIENKLKKKLDRVTLYRTLNSFLEKGVIHKVLDDSEAAKYALCAESCSPEAHNHNHVHFKCSKCGKSECLEGIAVPNINLPKGYSAREANLLVEGICIKCR